MYVLVLLLSIFVSFMYIVISVSDHETDGIIVAIALLVLGVYDLHKHGDIDPIEDEPWYRKNNNNQRSRNSNSCNSGSYNSGTTYDHSTRAATVGSESAKLLGDMHTMRNKTIKIDKEPKKDNVNGDE